MWGGGLTLCVTTSSFYRTARLSVLWFGQIPVVVFFDLHRISLEMHNHRRCTLFRVMHIHAATAKKDESKRSGWDPLPD